MARTHAVPTIDNSLNTSSYRDLITVTLRGGLGNQMFQYAIGLALASAGGRRLAIDTSMVDADPKREFALGSCRPQPKQLSLLNRLSYGTLRRTPLWPLAVRSQWPLYPGGPRVILERGHFYDPSLLSERGSLILDGYWQTEQYFHSHRQFVEKTFDWSETVTDQSDRELAHKVSAIQSVAVHVRRGDYAHDPHTIAFHGTCEPDYYARAARIILDHTSEAQFFVFSDDPDWAESNLRLPGPMNVVRHSGTVSPHVDMWLMSRCRHAIIANSSYSWWAAWLGERPGKCVVAPRWWYRDHVMRDVSPAPERWHRI